jgi:PAS domain S-box-containing protein
MLNFKKLSIKSQIVFIVTGVSIVTVFLTLLFNFFNQITNIRSNIEFELRKEMENIARQCIFPLKSGNIESIEQILEANISNDNYLCLSVLTDYSDNVISVGKKNSPDYLIAPEEVPAKKFKGNLLQINMQIANETLSYGSLTIIYFTGLRGEVISSGIICFIAFIIIILISFLLATHLQKYISKPILEMADITSKISKSKDYTIRLKRNSEDEIGFLYDNFNQMLETINKQQQEGKMANAALAHSEEKFRNIFNYNLDGILVTNKNGDILEVSDMICKLFKKNKNNLVGASIFDVMPDNYRKQRVEEIKTLENRGEVTFFSKYFTSENKEIFLEYSTKLIQYEGTECYLSFIRDITERIKNDEALRESERRYRKLIDNIPSAIILHRNGEILFVNNTVNVLLGGSTKKEFSGRQITDFIFPEYKASLEKQFRHVKDLEEVSGKIEAKLKSVNRENIYAEVISIPLVVSRMNAILTVFNNITERKNIEKELIKAKNMAIESDKLKSAFLANMSHEIRTPMNGIVGFADLLNKDSIGAEDVKRYVKIIKTSADRLLTIINDIIDISKIESGAINLAISEFNIYDLLIEIRHFYQPAIQKKGLDFIFEIDDKNQVIIQSDRVKLNQVISNLLTNAIKFTTKGLIKLSTKTNIQDGFIEIAVKDTGIGIPKDQQQKIFERFRQVNNLIHDYNEGTGLGLSISKGFIKALGGTISVASKVGEGTCFTLTIPFLKVVSDNGESNIGEKVQEKKPVVLHDYAEKTILIVEDEVNNYKYLEEILISTGAKIIWAKNGLVAVQEVIEKKNIDIVLMDVKLPIMDGYTATTKIKALREELPVVIQTAFGLKGDKKKSLELGCDDYIAKPIVKNELLSILDRFLIPKEKVY